LGIKIKYMKVEIKNIYEERIKNILPDEKNIDHEKYAEMVNILNRGMIFPKEISKNKVLFLGINPSFDEINKKDKNKFKADDEELEGHHELGYNELYFDDEISYNKPNKGYQSYFKEFEEICKGLKGNTNNEVLWTHYDMLPFREVSQKKITKYFNKENDIIYKMLIDFIELSREIIVHSEPKIIVVSNAYVRNLFGYNNEVNDIEKSHIPTIFKSRFSKEFGTHVIHDEQSGKLNGKPIFFTSMLSGQRALDVGSRDRLQWHINYCLNKI